MSIITYIPLRIKMYTNLYMSIIMYRPLRIKILMDFPNFFLNGPWNRVLTTTNMKEEL